MSFQPDPEVITWKLHLRADPQRVYGALSTDAGRAGFWAESAVEMDGVIAFTFPDGQHWQGRVLRQEPPRCYQVEYFGGSTATFELEPDGQGGTVLTLTDRGVPVADRTEVIAGWVSVLMALKASVDHGVDLRNHSAQHTWAQGFVDN